MPPRSRPNKAYASTRRGVLGRQINSLKIHISRVLKVCTIRTKKMKIGRNRTGSGTSAIGGPVRLTKIATKHTDFRLEVFDNKQQDMTSNFRNVVRTFERRSSMAIILLSTFNQLRSHFWHLLGTVVNIPRTGEEMNESRGAHPESEKDHTRTETKKHVAMQEFKKTTRVCTHGGCKIPADAIKQKTQPTDVSPQQLLRLQRLKGRRYRPRLHVIDFVSNSGSGCDNLDSNKFLQVCRHNRKYLTFKRDRGPMASNARKHGTSHPPPHEFR